MGGDECALCGNPVGENPRQFETDDGSIAALCPACAERIEKKLPLFDPADGVFDDPAEEPAETPKRSLEAPGDIQSLEEAVRAAEALAAFLRRLAPSMEELHLELTRSEDRVRALEAEVAHVRARLRRAEDLLAAAPAIAPGAAAPSAGTAAPVQAAAPQATEAQAGTPGAEPARPPATMAVPSSEQPPASQPASESGITDERVAAWARAGLTADDVRLVQRYFAESAATEKMRAVRRSLGRPLVNLHPVAGDRPRVMVTIAWEIVWYQFLVELAPELGSGDRVFAFAEGMELDELAPHFRVENATLDQGGRVDASELELALLAQPPELLTEMPPDRAAALDDATEEIWNKRGQPEFRWDD